MFLDVVTSNSCHDISCSLMMSRHHDLVATFTLVPCSLQWLLLMSRHRSLVVTSLNAFASFSWWLLMSRRYDVVATSAQVSCILLLVVMMSRPQRSCRDVSSWFGSFQLMSSWCHDLSIKSLPVSIGCSWCRDISLLLRQQLEVQHLHSPVPVVASRQFSCRDNPVLSRHHSLSFWLILSCLPS